MADADKDAFRRESERKSKGSLAQFVAFVFQNKKWWLIPIVTLLLLVAVLVALGGSGVAPFIYTLF
jgi:hypothetical protein